MELAVLLADEDDGVAGPEVLVADEVAPAGGEQLAARGAAVDVAERPLDAVHVPGGDERHGRVEAVVQLREDGERAEPRHGEAAAVVGVGRRQRLGERQRPGLPRRRLLAVAVPGAAPAAPVAPRQGVAHVRHRLPGAERDEAYPGVDVVGVGLRHEPDGRDAAGHERRDAHARGAQVHGGGAGVLGVALREVVDGGADGRHGAQGARARLPQLRVHAAPLGLGTASGGLRRWGRRGHLRRERERRRPEPRGRAGCSNRHDWVIGRAQGFYVASSQDGTSKTIVLTAMLEGPEAPHGGDTLSFFGVHRMAAPESHIAIIGGTGKYEHAKGFAAIQTLHPGDEHTTDGVETLLQFNVHLI